MRRDGTVLALDISGSRAMLAAIAGEGTILGRDEVPNRTGEAASYWPEIRAAAARLCAAHACRAVGISFGGPVGNDGRILSIHVGGWSALDPAADLRAALEVPVQIENDANCGALGEVAFGRWGEPHTLIFMTCSTGIGGGIVSEGRLVKGARGLGGELGHISLHADGPTCPCGARGCLEVLCCGTAIGRRATEALAAHPGPRSALADALVDGVVLGARPVFTAAAAGDALAQAVLEAVFADFGRGIAAIHNALDPELIVIGGGVALAGEALTGPVAAAARPWLMSHRRDHLRLHTASLGLDSQLYGAASLAFAAA